MKFTNALLWAATVMHGAVYLDGAKVVEPLFENDPSPIADPLTYMPEQQDCPSPCSVDYGNAHKWTPYYSIDRLQRHGLPILLYSSVLHPLDEPNTDVLIRSCALGTDPTSTGDRSVTNATSTHIENPKLKTDLLQPMDLAPACAVEGHITSGELVLTTSAGRASSRAALAILDGIKTFFNATDDCYKTFLFAYYNQTVAGVHIGAALGKRTVTSVVQAVAGELQASSFLGNQTVAQS
jgi:hypothetical protein